MSPSVSEGSLPSEGTQHLVCREAACAGRLPPPEGLQDWPPWVGMDWQHGPSALGLSQEQGLLGIYTLSRRRGLQDLLFTWTESQASGFPGGPPLAGVLSLPASLLLLQVLGLTHLFLHVSCGCLFGLPSPSQECCISGIGKPVPRSSSDPPINSRCPRQEEPTPGPSPPLKRQVGLLPVDAVLVKSEGTFIQRGGVGGCLCTPCRADCRICGKAELGATALIGKNNQVCSIWEHVPVSSQVFPATALLTLHVLG